MDPKDGVSSLSIRSWFPDLGFQSVVSICFALGNKSGSFCEAVNCERSEQEGKFLFVTLTLVSSPGYHNLVTICDAGFHFMITPPSKASWHNARESAESGGTIHYKHYYENKLFE